MAQLDENQHNTLAQMFDNNQSLVDLLEQLIPLAKFLIDSLWIISYVINLCLILTILHWTLGIDIDTRIQKIGVLGLRLHGIYFVMYYFVLVVKHDCGVF